MNHEGPTTGTFLSDRLDNVHLTAGGARSAQRTLAGEGICTLQRDVEIVNPLEFQGALILAPAKRDIAPLRATAQQCRARYSR